MARAQLTPPASAYEWADPNYGLPDASDAANWHAPDGTVTLPPEGAHLIFGNRPDSYYQQTLTGFGNAPLPSRFAALWFGSDDIYDFLSYTLTGSAITVGYGTDAIDRLIVAKGNGSHTLDLDVIIHDAPGLAFRIVNTLTPSSWGVNELAFEQSLTSTGTLIVDGYGLTRINALHGSGALIKAGTGLLLADAANYTGEVIIRDGALVGTVSDDSALTLAGGVYGLADGFSSFERDLGQGTGKVRWLAGKSGGFTALDGTELHVTLDGGRALTWGEAHFVSIGSDLHFGSATADGNLHWHNALDLGDPLDSSARTIRVNGDYDWSGNPAFTLHLGEEIIAAMGQKLRFIGGGTIVISADNTNFHGDLEIAGVALSLSNGGRFANVGQLDVRDGGTLAISIGAGEDSPLSSFANISLTSATLRWGDDPSASGLTRNLGVIIIDGGASHIARTGAANSLHAASLTRNAPCSTLLVELISPDYNLGDSLMEFDDASAFTDTAIGGIAPWLVVTTGANKWDPRSDWGIFDINGHLKPYVNYYEGAESTWSAGDNINQGPSGGTATLSADRTINSLRMDNVSIDLAGHTLTLGSGGLLFSGGGRLYDEVGTSTLTTAAGRPLYVHAHGWGQSYIAAQITGGMDLVKTGAGSLSLVSAGWSGGGHSNALGAVYIHQGELELTSGVRIASTGAIYVGDRGHAATLRLHASEKAGAPPLLTGRREVRLRGGTDYEHAATLSLVGAHDLHLAHLSIEGSSVLEFSLPWAGGISKIYSELFTFESASSRLLVRGWAQWEGVTVGEVPIPAQYTHILVRKTSPGLDDYLSQIWFEEYGPAKKINWTPDDTFWEIVPGGFTPWGGDPGPPPGIPEPGLTGAITAIAGIGFLIWRKRKKRQQTRGSINPSLCLSAPTCAGRP